jgi:peptidoglycan/LPS O-acetylase OafA/YrhL
VHFFPTIFSPIAASNSYGDFRQYLLSAIFTIFYIGNFFGLANLGYQDLYAALGHFWSLAVEEQFYFIWPLVLQLVLRYWPRKLTLVCLLGIVSTPIIHLFLSFEGKSSWTLPTSYLDLFFFGALFAIYKVRIANLHFPLALIALGCLTMASLVYFNVQVEDFSSQGYLLFALTEIILFLGLLNWSLFGRIRILCKLGDWSYALYCIHWPVIRLLHGVQMNSLVKILLAAIISIMLSGLSTKYFETIFWKPRDKEIVEKI